jgi:MHS family proline/betaine transporter-like MFS transporter
MKKINAITIASILIGTILEWYDFSLLGSMAPIISTLFFPSKSHTVSLLATFSVFASGFLIRPFGGILFGHIGDRYGRRSALSTTIILMALPTTLIGLLPTFYFAGVLAPVMLVLLRLIQGTASSGEYPGAICFLTEIAPPTKRGFWGSISMLGVAGGVLLGTLINALLSFYLSTEQMYSWGWRIPFLIGLPLGVIGFYLRYKVKESGIFISAKLSGETFKLPIRQIIKFNLANLGKVILLFSLSTISFYLGFVYIDTYLVSTHKITLHEALVNNTFGTIALILCIPFFGYLSDKINRKYIMFAGTSCLFVFFYPIFTLFLSDNHHGLLLGQLLLAVFIAMFVGPMAAATAEIFSTLTRYSGVSAGLNIGASIFGGTCPLLATYLVYYSGMGIMPCVYPMLFAFLCLFVVYNLPNNQKHLLNSI